MSAAEPEIWGLTGGIASGKSTVAKLLAEEGFHVVDADRVSRELSHPGGLAEPAILARFGTADRGELRKLVFADAKARKDLEAILHPLIQTESLRQMRGNQGRVSKDGKRRVFYEATLLIEAGRTADCHGLIVVEAPLERRRAWLGAREGLSTDGLGARFSAVIAAQLSDAERRKHATVIIENSGNLDELKVKVASLIEQCGWR